MFKAVIFDLDGTITRPVSSWRYIHEKLGKWDVLACRYQEMFLAGKISYRQFCELDARCWKGLPEEKIREMFAGIPFNKNAVFCLKKLRKLGLKLFGLSTGLQYVVQRVEEEVPFDGWLSNRLCSRKGVLTGQVKINITHGGKGRVLSRLLGPAGIRPEEAIAVGDSDGDLSLARACGYAIAFNSKSKRLNQVRVEPIAFGIEGNGIATGAGQG
ncbi:MAG TPA: HAD family phosphatase, partial [bacterium]|nr:HAD family phosphatase [bacterium]